MVLAVSLMTTAGVVWLAAGGPTGIDRWLDVTEPAVSARAIVVLGGGTAAGNLPLPQGWERLSTAAELFRDGLAPTVIFSGGGTSVVSESEIYATAGAWLGIPRDAMRFEPMAQSTADHGRALLGFQLPDGSAIERNTPLLVVTSTFHSRRALMSFHDAGFTHVRIVSSYTARGPAPSGTPSALTNSIPTHTASGKRYDDVLFQMAYRTFDFFIGLREVGAIMVTP
jgi:uncharacterized SAM-binding protein YcdF (DUF218 family)